MELEIYVDGTNYVVRWSIRGIYVNFPDMESAQDFALKMIFKYEGIE